MKKFMLLVLCVILVNALFSQIDIYALMERRDININQIKGLANKHFEAVGKERGSGYKQFQRWLYESKFHLDEKGFIQDLELDWKNYTKARAAQPALQTAGVWTEMGPSSWNMTTGWNPGVGAVLSVAVNPIDTSILYVSSAGGGIWKSTNSGAGWIPLVDNNANWMNVFHLAIDPVNTNTIYASVTGGGIIKSTDGGASWNATGNGPIGSKKVLVNPSNSAIVFTAANNGIFRSENSGTSWTQVHSFAKEDIEFKPGNPSIVYASGNGDSSALQSSVYRSADNGVTWTAITVSQGITNYGRTLLAVSPNDPNVLYAVQANGEIFGRMYRSSNSGESFVTTVVGNYSNGTQYFGFNTSGGGKTGQASYDMGICVNPLNVNEVLIAGIIVWKSTNGGTSFMPKTSRDLPSAFSYNHPDIHALEWVKKTIYSGSDGGIYNSTDQGNNWVDISSGLGIRQFYRIAVSKTNPDVFTGGSQDNGSSVHSSTGWIDWLGADGMDCLISPTDENLIWGTSQFGTMFRSSNQGATYSHINEPASGQWITPLACESNSNTIYAGWDGVYRSLDSGNSWTNISGSSINNLLDALSVAPSNPAYIYASSGSTIYVTKNGGASWMTIAAPATVTSFAVSPLNPEKVWISCANYINRVFASTNACASFTSIAGNLPNIAARSIVVDDDANETLYIGMNLGVYAKDNTMSEWVDLSGNLPKVAVNEVEIQHSGGKLLLATYGRGVWSTDLYNAGPSCPAPGTVTVENIGFSDATINWEAVPGANSYSLQYKPTAASNFITINTNTGTSLLLSGLSSLTAYDYQVKANCPSGGSVYSPLQSFTTISNPCTTASLLAPSNITSSTGVINWNPVAVASGHNLQYKTNASAVFTTVSNISGTSFTLTGLTPQTLYNYKVSTNCTSGMSDYGAVQYFTTSAPALPTCDAPGNLQAPNIGGASAQFTWNAVANASTYEIRYKMSKSKNWTIIPAQVTGTSYLLSGLSTRTNYDVQVWVYCNNSLSNYSALGFRTNNSAVVSPLVIDESIKEALQLFPNPAHEFVNIKLREDTYRNAQLLVIDSYGRILKNWAATGTSNTLNISRFAPGVYMVKLVTTDGIYLQRFVKQ